MSLDIQVYPPVNGNHYVTLAGRLDTHTHQLLDAHLSRLLQSPRRAQVLVLDLAGVEYISSAGIRSIFKARKALVSCDGRVLLLNPQAQIKEVLDLVNAVPVHEIFATPAEADAYIDTIQQRVLDG